MTTTLDLIWFSTGAAAPRQIEAWRKSLSPREQVRADRFVMPGHGHRYRIAHARLRDILAARLECSPRAVAFEHGRHGKPRLSRSCDPEGRLYFNLSHSGDFALVGVSDAEVGVDIERERPRLDGLALAHRFFTPEESAWLAALPPADRVRGFARLWTCKEAMLKADGRGLALPLKSFGVELGPEGATLRASAGVAKKWWVKEFDLVPGYAVAVVQRGAPAVIRVEHRD